jgi:hypothetical protein
LGDGPHGRPFARLAQVRDVMPGYPKKVRQCLRSPPVLAVHSPMVWIIGLDLAWHEPAGFWAHHLPRA